MGKLTDILVSLHGRLVGLNEKENLVVNGKLVALTLTDSQGNITAIINGDGSKPSTAAVDSQVRAPVGSPIPTDGGAGNLTGTYGYAVLFRLSDGTRSSPWGGTATTLNVTSRRINLSSIPVSSDSRVVARDIYRTIGAAVDVKDYFLVGSIEDNTTTTYVDNLADTTATPMPWISTANWHFENSLGAFFSGLGMDSQALAIGFNARAGYASLSIGYEAGKSNTTGRRNFFAAQYAGTSNTTGYQNTFGGVHAGQNNTTGFGSTLIGCYAGYSVTTQEEIVAIGNQALGNLTTIPGRRIVSIGASSMSSITAGINSGTAVGFASGKYADASYQMYLDIGIDRANTANGKNAGLIFGQGDTTANVANQYLNLNGSTRLGADGLTVSALTTALPANAANRGRRSTVVDASVAYTSANVGSTVAGGGSNVVPVFCNGISWVIG